jgi:hypothetical protein
MARDLKSPKILVLDIETAPILASVWSLWEQNVGLNQIEKDWHVLSWAAKWYGEPAAKTMYMDQRSAKNIADDRAILLELWKLIDEADVLVTQNGNKFDIKKLNSRFLYHGFGPPSPSKSVDTFLIAKKKFGFTSNKLEYMTQNFCKKYKKSKHKKFPGFELWKECLSGNKLAWTEMEKYNKWDVLSLEELYAVFRPWDNQVNPDLYRDGSSSCSCGHKTMQKRGFYYTAVAKYQRYWCPKCGAWSRGRKNEIDSEKRKGLRVSL